MLERGKICCLSWKGLSLFDEMTMTMTITFFFNVCLTSTSFDMEVYSTI